MKPMRSLSCGLQPKDDGPQLPPGMDPELAKQMQAKKVKEKKAKKVRGYCLIDNVTDPAYGLVHTVHRR